MKANFVQKLFNLYEKKRGKRSFKKISSHQLNQGKYELKINVGFIIIIFCDEIRYECTYEKLFPRKKILLNYHVYSVCTGSIPKDIETLFKKEITMPAILHLTATSSDQRRAAIDAYVDILSEEVKSLKKEHKPT